jgi:putative nucleotidyltransferase with HDIG domain
MILMLEKQAALDLVRKYVTKENNIKHMISVGGIMRSVASRLNEDANKWELVGILHDIDYEVCAGPADHTVKAKEMLRDFADEEMIEAIMAHNFENTNVPVDSRLKIGLIACDAASGLVLACTLVMPSKKLADVKLESVIKKFRAKDFAKGVSRERMQRCTELSLTLEEFLALALKGMNDVSGEIGF